MLQWCLPSLRFYHRVLSYFLADWVWLILLLSSIACATLMGLLQVWPLALLVDVVLSPTHSGSGNRLHSLVHQWNEYPRAQIVALACAGLLLRLLHETANVCSSMLSHRVGNGGLLRVRCDLFRKLQSLHIAFHHSQPQGDTIYRLTNDAAGGQGVLNVMIETLVAACTLTVMLAILWHRNIQLTLVALGVVPLLLITNIWFGRVLRNQTINAKQRESQFTTTARRSVASMLLVQAFGRESQEMHLFRTLADHSLRAWFQFHRQFACYRLCIGTIMSIGAALIFGLGGQMVYHDQFLNPTPQGMSVGDLVVFLTYLTMLYDPLCKLSGAATTIQQSAVGMKRVFEVLDRRPAVQDRIDSVPLPVQPRSISFENVSFQYEERQQVLQNLSLRIEPGDMVAFVGSSGGGKSTLLNLLPRFYDPVSGIMRLDDHDARDVCLRDLRSHIALVLQESVILPTTVAENIAYGRVNASPEEIREAAELAGAMEFIEKLPDGLETVICEGGVNFSGGQRQRIAIARALLTRAPILVLDEPSSALDPLHERRLRETLKRIQGTRTIILVSHRMNTVIDCDCIYVMDRGRIVEHGTHDELLRRDGFYSTLAGTRLSVVAA
jgi:ATP-binding cassette, subfamily B, bacterial